MSLSSDGVHRIRREGGPIEKIGIGAMFASDLDLPRRLGGPARSQVTGEVIGVVSAGVMDDDDQTRDPTTFTRLDIWRPMFANAQLIVDGSSPAEVPPVGGAMPNSAKDGVRAREGSFQGAGLADIDRGGDHRNLARDVHQLLDDPR